MSKGFTSGNINNNTAPNSNSRGIQPTNSGTCDTGYTNCPVFGCIQGTQCPAPCLQRTTSLACTGSVNGKGCKWVSNTCVEDRQCPISSTGSCGTGCQGCGVFQCINQGLQCPVKCERLGQSSCGKGATVNGIGCAWMSGVCVAWDVIRGGMVGPGATSAVEYMEPLLSPEESARLFASATIKPTLTPTPTPIPTPIPTSTTTTTKSESPMVTSSTSSSPSPSPTSGSDTQNPDASTTSKGMSSSGKAALVILIMAIAGLMSWGGLYYFTRDKVNFHRPSLLINQKVLPIYNGSPLATAHNNNPGGVSSNENMSTLRDSYGYGR
ncbi:hypothetical protein GGI13_001849 [Coemansia sp. RSA 455]|nr:hypothetical protein GGI13_001849 [Coemansia sp. RSA 455]